MTKSTGTKKATTATTETTAEFITKVAIMTNAKNLVKMTAQQKETMLKGINDKLKEQLKVNDRKKLNEIKATVEASLKATSTKIEKAPAPAKKEETKPAPAKKEEKAPAKKKEAFKVAHDLQAGDKFKFKETVKKELTERTFEVIKIDLVSNKVLAQNIESFEDCSVFLIEKDEKVYILYDIKTDWQTVATKLKK